MIPSRRLSSALRPLGVCLGAVSLVACATPMPPGPTLVAIPHPGEDYATFRQHDNYCQATAARDTGTSPSEAANNHEVASAVIGTGVGAAAGALLGAAGGAAGPGAAIGAGAGLLFGSAAGADSGGNAAAHIQHRYNVVYAQCMTAYGEHIQGPHRRYYPRPYAPYPPYPPPPPPGYGSPY